MHTKPFAVPTGSAILICHIRAHKMIAAYTRWRLTLFTFSIAHEIETLFPFFFCFLSFHFSYRYRKKEKIQRRRRNRFPVYLFWFFSIHLQQIRKMKANHDFDGEYEYLKCDWCVNSENVYIHTSIHANKYSNIECKYDISTTFLHFDNIKF